MSEKFTEENIDESTPNILDKNYLELSRKCIRSVLHNLWLNVTMCYTLVTADGWLYKFGMESPESTFLDDSLPLKSCVELLHFHGGECGNEFCSEIQ